MILNCDCDFHQIEINSFELMTNQQMIEILIYQHKSFVTGKVFKKRKLLADVVLNPDVAKCFIESIKNGIF